MHTLRSRVQALCKLHSGLQKMAQVAVVEKSLSVDTHFTLTPCPGRLLRTLLVKCTWST